MYTINRIIGLLLSGILSAVFYKLDEIFEKKGWYYQGRYYNTRYTIWGPFFYISIILFLMLLFF